MNPKKHTQKETGLVTGLLCRHIFLDEQGQEYSVKRPIDGKAPFWADTASRGNRKKNTMTIAKTLSCVTHTIIMNTGDKCCPSRNNYSTIPEHSVKTSLLWV